jgi:hypothetical protein
VEFLTGVERGNRTPFSNTGRFDKLNALPGASPGRSLSPPLLPVQPRRRGAAIFRLPARKLKLKLFNSIILQQKGIPMTPQAKLEMIRQQVISKIHWGTSEDEVRQWLRDTHQITGANADKLLGDADRSKRKAVREKAVVQFAVSAIGLVLFCVAVIVSLSHGWILVGGQSMVITVILFGAGLAIMLQFIRSLRLLLTGESSGTVD